MEPDAELEQPWSAWGPRAAVAFAAVVAVVTFAASDNVHTAEETVAFDRLMLALRWLEPLGHGRWDPNFALGTPLLLAPPQVLGLDPVAWGRTGALLAAAGATALAWSIVRFTAGRGAAAWVVAALWCVPAFVRGAVVVGEEALYAASLLACLWWLIQAQESGQRAWLAVIAANAMVLVRLDAIAMIPGVGIAAVLLLGLRRGALFTVLASVTTGVHLLVGARGAGSWNGDPLGFLRVVTHTVERSGGGAGGLRLLPELADAFGRVPGAGWLILVVLIVGVGAALRAEERATRALGAAAGWLLLVAVVASARGALEPSIHRYWVPLLALLLVTAAASSAALGPRARWVAAGVLLLLAPNLLSVREQAATARLPTGLEDAAVELSARAGDQPVLVGEQHPTIVILSGLDWDRVSVLPAGAPDQNTAAVLREALDASQAGWLLQVSGNPPARAVRAALGGPPAFTTPCCSLYRVAD